MKIFITRTLLHAIRFIFVLSISTVPVRAAQTWPQFRGAQGDGTSTATGLPTVWNENENIRWKTAIPGKGYSSPVIITDKIWLTTSPDEGRSRNLIAVDFASGDITLNKTLFTVAKPELCHRSNSFATPTPVLENNRVYVNFGAAGTACVAAESGRIIWQRRDFNVTYHDVGAASSPIIHDDKLIMIFDGDNKSARFVTALDKTTGATIWRTERVHSQEQLKGMVHSSCTPHVITVAGQKQVICPGGLYAAAYDLTNGREIWRVRYRAWSVVPRPLYSNGLLYICAGVVKPVMLCINPLEARGDITNSDRIVWQSSRQVPNMPSPLLINNRFYTMTSAKLACRKADTGEIIWDKRIGGQHEASPVYAEGNIFLFNKSGDSSVVKASDIFQTLGNNTLESGCWASPAIHDKSLLVRTEKHLYRIERVD
jgi:outer membrane protein assembly factor BamB